MSGVRRVFRDDGTSDTAWHKCDGNVILCTLESEVSAVFQPTSDKPINRPHVINPVLVKRHGDLHIL